MQTIDSTALRVEDASSLWLGSAPAGWREVVHEVESDARAAGDVITAAGLGWRVEQHPIEAIVERDGLSSRVPAPQMMANIRTDTGRVVGVVGRGYRPLQNADAFAFADALVDSGEAHWLGAGSTRGGARIHTLMRLDREIRIGGVNGEDVVPLLLLRNGHDGGLAVTVSVAPFRLVCLNGMLLPLDGVTRTWKARHTAKVGEKLGDARRTLQIAWRYYDGLQALGERLIRQRLTDRDFDDFLARLVPLPPPRADETGGGRAVRNAERVREAIRTAYRATPDLEHIRGTRWGALQAVTTYHDHQAQVRRTTGRTPAEARFERATEPACLKDRALALLTA